MPNRRLFLFIFAIVFLSVIALLWKAPGKDEPVLPKAASFEECAAQGNPIMESYPRQCRSKEGVLFVETIVEAK